MQESSKGPVNPDEKPNSNRIEGWAAKLNSTVFLLLLTVIVLSIIPYGAVDEWWESVFECAVFVLTALWILEVLFRGEWRVKKLSILLPLILITAYAFSQTIVWPASIGVGRLSLQPTITIDRYQTYLTARKCLALTLFLGLLLSHTTTSRRFHWLVRALLGLGLASALFGISRQFLQAPDSDRGFVLPFLFAGIGFGQFLSPNVLAYLMEMLIALGLGLRLGGAVKRERIPIYLVGVLIIWAALVLSNSRGAILGFVTQSIFLLFMCLSWYSMRRLSQGESKPAWLRFIQTSVLVRLIVIVLLSATLLAGVVWMGGQELASKIDSQANTEERQDGLTRRDIWHSSWQLVKDHPITGVGFGAYFLAIPRYQSGSGRIKLEQAHNDYLDLAANGGLIAVALACWFIGILVWRLRVSFKSLDSYRCAAALGAAAGMLSVGVHSSVDFGLQVTGIGVVFAALVVVGIADDQLVSRPQQRNVNRLRRRPRRKLLGDVTGVEP